VVPEFYHSGWETHISANLWENFSALDPDVWLTRLAQKSGLQFVPENIQAVNWSYGWVDPATRRIVDIIVHYRTKAGKEGVIVVEAKSPWGAIKPGKDSDPAYYMGLPVFEEFTHRSLLYLVDQKDLKKVQGMVKATNEDVGFLSWQDLGGIQIQSSRSLDISPDVTAFVAGAIQSQFLGFGIRPSALVFNYLSSEPSRREHEFKTSSEHLCERRKERWRIPT